MAMVPIPIQNDPTTTAISRYQQQALTPLSQAQALTIRSADDYRRAGEEKVACRTLRQKIEGWYAGTKDRPGPKTLAHMTWKDLCDKEKTALGSLTSAESLYEKKMLAWKQVDDARVRREQVAADAEARRKAEDERLVSAVALAAEAEQYADPHLMAAAESLLDLPLETAPAVVGSDVPKVAGLAQKKQLVITVTDPLALVLDVAAHAMFEALVADCLHGKDAAPETHAINRFLKQFMVGGRDALDGVRKDKDGAIDGIGPFDINAAWLRSEWNKKRDRFSLAGVIAKEVDRII